MLVYRGTVVLKTRISKNGKLKIITESFMKRSGGKFKRTRIERMNGDT